MRETSIGIRATSVYLRPCRGEARCLKSTIVRLIYGCCWTIPLIDNWQLISEQIRQITAKVNMRLHLFQLKVGLHAQTSFFVYMVVLPLRGLVDHSTRYKPSLNTVNCYC